MEFPPNGERVQHWARSFPTYQHQHLNRVGSGYANAGASSGLPLPVPPSQTWLRPEAVFSVRQTVVPVTTTRTKPRTLHESHLQSNWTISDVLCTVCHHFVGDEMHAHTTRTLNLHKFKVLRVLLSIILHKAGFYLHLLTSRVGVCGGVVLQ